VGESVPYKGRDNWVWLKNFHPVTLGARWLGPFQVILSTSTAVRLAEKPHWFHVTQIKPAAGPHPAHRVWAESSIC
uniref:Murine leukemia virus integrase C-terminal domain-containing protein n=1 Tax=Varanus komodoensis TaxID=61221 RepID=A0A8D2IU53_VARKO